MSFGAPAFLWLLVLVPALAAVEITASSAAVQAPAADGGCGWSYRIVQLW